MTQVENISKYSIIKKLGGGATSQVFHAISTNDQQHVALKLIDPNLISDKTSAKAFKKLLQVEASLVGKLTHPHIVQMLDAAVTDELSYIVMEYVSGGSLEPYAQADRLLPFTKVAELMLKCCKALEYADSQGVIHRDIKPANILLEGENNIKISDFGAAMVADGDSTMVSGVGSLYYMSPEQITGETLTRQTDIYSLGVTMSRLLTGKVPFQASSGHGIMYEIVNNDQPPPRAHRSDIPEELDTIVQRATRKDLSQRYQSWDEFARDLEAFLQLGKKAPEPAYDVQRFNALRNAPFFENFSDAELLEVYHLGKWHKTDSGTAILQEGEMGNALFILISGIVKVVRNGRVVAFLHKGDCFGEIRRLPNSLYTRTTGVETGTDCILFEVGLDLLAKTSLECRFQFDEAILYVLLQRLDAANTRISKLLAGSEQR